jgi:hypothetical protein
MVARADDRGVVSIYAERIELEPRQGEGAPPRDRLLDPDLEEGLFPPEQRLDRPADPSIPIYTLPDGYRFSEEPPEASFDSFQDPDIAAEAADQGSFRDPGLVDATTFRGPDAGDLVPPLQLALYLPDGSAIVSSPLYLIIGDPGDQTAYTVALSQWSGGCEIRPAPTEEGLFGTSPMNAGQPTRAPSGTGSGTGSGAGGRNG